MTAFHGTSRKNFRSILRDRAFRLGTWFAFNVRDALHYGGDYVFECEFREEGFKGPDEWQFHLRDAMGFDEIPVVGIGRRVVA